jgi:hypothetical protein
VGADPIENAQTVDWSVQGIYFRTLSASEDLTLDYTSVVRFLEDKPQKVGRWEDMVRTGRLTRQNHQACCGQRGPPAWWGGAERWCRV